MRRINFTPVEGGKNNFCVKGRGQRQKERKTHSIVTGATVKD